MLRSELTSARQTSKLNLGADDVRSMITICYADYVARRNATLIADKRTSDAINSIASWLTAKEAKISLLIQGTIGCGKTTLAKALCSGIAKLRDRAEAYVNEHGWKLPIEQRNQLRNDIYALPATHYIPALQVNELAKSSEQLSKLMRTAGILVIDDLGQEETSIKDYGTTRLPMIELINYRYDHYLPMVITTNLDDKKIAERYGERIMDRLREDCNTITCVGDSYRSNK